MGLGFKPGAGAGARGQRATGDAAIEANDPGAGRDGCARGRRVGCAGGCESAAAAKAQARAGARAGRRTGSGPGADGSAGDDAAVH
eukprot:6834405-Prymnesium_polylepis.1